MKKILLGMAAVSALAIGTPAAAQFGLGSDVQARVGQLHSEINVGVRSGAISQAEEAQLMQQLGELTQIEREYSRDGLSGRERGYLMQRINNLRQQIRYAERSGGYDRNERYGDRDWQNDRRWDDRNDRNERYGRSGWVDRDRDGQDDRYQSRDRRWEDARNDPYDRSDPWGRDERYGRNDPYGRDGWVDRNRNGRDDREEGYRNRGYDSRGSGGILGGVLGGVLGGGRGVLGGGGVGGAVLGTVLRGVLGVGQIAPSNLYGVPSQYQNQFRDGNGVYYRSDGQAIYQIDARTQTVMQVHPIGR